MKNFCIISLIVVLFCFLSAVTFLGLGGLLCLFLPITLFQATMILIAPFCILLILIPLLLINQKLEQMIFMGDEDYMLWDEDQQNIKLRPEKKRPLQKKQQQKIIVMENSPIFDKNAPCPCGSGEKYKNCCGKTGKSTKK